MGKKVGIVAAAAAALAAIPATATPIWLNYSGSAYIFAGPTNTFSFTAFYDPAIVGSRVQITEGYFTLTEYDYQLGGPKTTRYSVGSGSGSIVAAPDYLYGISPGTHLISAGAGTASAGLSIYLVASTAPGTFFTPGSFGDVSYRVNGQGYSGELVRFLTVTAVPEPITWAMMILGIATVGASLRYRRRSTKIAFA